MFDTCDATQTQSYADTCKQIVINRAVAVEDTTAVQEDQQYSDDISTLVSRIEMSQDAKESQDLANTIIKKCTVKRADHAVGNERETVGTA
jgi:type IV secretion system protein VirB5